MCRGFAYPRGGFPLFLPHLRPICTAANRPFGLKRYMPHFETDAAVFRPRFVIVRLGVSLSRLLRELPGFFIREASPSMKPLKFHTPSLTGHSNISAFAYAYDEMYAPILFGGICCTAQCLCVSGRLSVANGKASGAPVSAVRRHATASTLLSVRVFLTLRPYPQGCFCRLCGMLRPRTGLFRCFLRLPLCRDFLFCEFCNYNPYLRCVCCCAYADTLSSYMRFAACVRCISLSALICA